MADASRKRDARACAQYSRRNSIAADGLSRKSLPLGRHGDCAFCLENTQDKERRGAIKSLLPFALSPVCLKAGDTPKFTHFHLPLRTSGRPTAYSRHRYGSDPPAAGGDGV